MLLKRIGYYLIGLSIGSIGVYFFWQKKNASFDYGMDARTLKSIRTKKRIYTNEAALFLEKQKIDTATVSSILKFGDVDFSKSKARQKPCAEYYITGKGKLKKYSIYVSRCDSTATIEKLILN